MTPDTKNAATKDAGGKHDGPRTLAIDIGGTGLKASVLDAAGEMMADRVRVVTTYPMSPEGNSQVRAEGNAKTGAKANNDDHKNGHGHADTDTDSDTDSEKGNGGTVDVGLVPALVKLVASLPAFDRVSAGFPGMVRKGVILSAPHFVTESGPGSPESTDLVAAWNRFDLAAALTGALGKPTRVANDADVQGLAVVSGKGLELVVTLGTGFGTALFLDGELLPHLEIAHQPFRKGQTYNDQLGERTRKDVGEDRWNRRVRKALVSLDALSFCDHIYIGGGNASRVKRDDLGDLLDKTSVVENKAGILGGLKLWEGRHLGV